MAICDNVLVSFSGNWRARAQNIGVLARRAYLKYEDYENVPAFRSGWIRCTGDEALDGVEGWGE